MALRNMKGLIMATAVATFLLVMTSGLARTLGVTGHQISGKTFLESPLSFILLIGYRSIALLVASLAVGVLVQGWRQWRDRPVFALVSTLLAIAALPIALGGSAVYGSALAAQQVSLCLAILSTWMLTAIHWGGELSYRSRLSMFRSQWQVPLYAAIAVYLVILLGGYLKSMGAEAACAAWPFCSGLWTGPLSGLEILHLAHRSAAALAGILLCYTAFFVWTRHLHRPVLLLLTALAIVFYAAQVVLGAQAATLVLTKAGYFGHFAIAALLACTLLAVAVAGYYSPSLPAIAGASAVIVADIPRVRPLRQLMRDYLDTTKPRILVLLLLTAYAAMWVASKGLPDLWLTVVTMIGLGMSCGAANAINMWYDQDIDAVMSRTKPRPIPSGRLTPSQVLGFGLMTGALSFVLLAAAVNLLTAVLSLSGLLFYVLIYTMWLKRSTDQNIVIGGAAGAVPPLVGWAAVTGDIGWAAVIMFLVIFVWTPPHFWALALFRNEDYKQAGVPMLPVIRGERYTKWQILFYAIALIPTVMALYWVGAVGKLYLWISVGATLVYFGANVMLFFERPPVYKWAVRSFICSLFWLTLIFMAAVLDIQ